MYYIYQHKDLTGLIFYVGKGTKFIKGKTLRKIYSRAYSRGGRSLSWKKISKDGYTIEIVEENESLEFILNRENELWTSCRSCVNKQLNNKFKNYSIIKINDDIAIFNIFGKTYLIFSDGYILNYLGKELSPWDNGEGYKVITISDPEKRRKNLYVHRLIAEAFVENPNRLVVVNHVNLDRSDNRSSNLEWCTQKENIHHSARRGSYENINKIHNNVYQFSKDGKFIKEWKSINEISETFNCTCELIYSACNQKNKCKTAKGFVWIYKEDYETNSLNDFTMSLLKKIE